MKHTNAQYEMTLSSKRVHTTETRLPGLLGNSPITLVALNTEGVDAALDQSPAVITPVSTPRVAENPIVGSVLRGTKSSNGDGVHFFGAARLVNEDGSAFESLKLLSHTDCTADRSACGNLLHHDVSAINDAVLLDLVLGVLVNCPATLSRCAVTADVVCLALAIEGTVVGA